MGRPKPISLENADALYDYYADFEPSRRLLRTIHAGADLLLDPATAYLPDSREQLSGHLDQGQGLLLSLSHASALDPFHIAAVIKREKFMHPIIGNIVIPANASWMNYPVAGSVIHHAGGLPAFREEDVFGRQPVDKDPAIEAKRLAAGQRLVELTIQKYRQGSHLPYFTEGTRNRHDPKVIQKIKKGLVTAANTINTPDGDGIMIACMSIYYGDKTFGKKSLGELRKPAVAIGHLALEAGEQLDRETLRQRQQECLDMAIEQIGK